MEKIKILGITGPSGCGKDTAARWLTKHNYKYKYVKLHTTRPQRNEDDNGYYFCNPGFFLKEILNGNMLNAQEFRGWYYGLRKGSLYPKYINVIPMNNEMIYQMLEEQRNDYDLQIIYINTNPKERLQHIIDREKNPDCYEICRRFLTDKTDYETNTNLKDKCRFSIINRYTDEFYRTLERNAAACFEDDYDKIV